MSEPMNDVSLREELPALQQAGVRFYARVRGYRLEVPEGWGYLDQYARRRLQNGIGPERWPPKYRRLIDEATGFRAVADVHDLDYCLGRTAADRRTGDRRFLRNCLRVIAQDGGGVLGILIRGSWRATLTRLLVAWVLYRALRLGGRAAFEAAPKC